MANDWNYEIEEYLCGLRFDSEEEREALRKFYRKSVAQRIGSPSPSVINNNEQRLAAELYNDDNLAIIPFMSKVAEIIAIGYRYDPRDKLGWFFLAALLKEWINGKGNVIPKEKNGPSGTTYFISDDFSIYSDAQLSANMDWLLSYPKAQLVYDQLVNIEQLKNDQGFINNLAAIFFDDPAILLTVGSRFWSDTVKDSTATEKNMEAKYYKSVRTGEIEYSWPENISQTLAGWDGMCAALHGFFLYLVVGGTITSVSDQEVIVEIDQLGVFFKDNFDFSDVPGKNQFLGGPWTVPYRYIGPPVFLSNQCYRTYRDITGMGKDFYVISRNKVIQLSEENKLSFILRRFGNSSFVNTSAVVPEEDACEDNAPRCNDDPLPVCDDDSTQECK